MFGVNQRKENNNKKNTFSFFVEFVHSHFRAKALWTFDILILPNTNKWWEWWECSWQRTNINLGCFLFSYYPEKKTTKFSCSRQYICINVFLCVLWNRKTYAEAKTTEYWVCRGPDFKTEKCKEISMFELKCPLIQSEISKALFLYCLETCFCLPVYNSFHKQCIFTLFFSYSLIFL